MDGVLIMTDPAIIAASYAAERNYSHNPDDVIDPSGAVLAIGTEKVDTTTLKNRALNNDATIHGAMPAEGFIQSRRFTKANENYLDCGNDSSLDIVNYINIRTLIKFTTLETNTFIFGGSASSKGYSLRIDNTNVNMLSFYIGDSSSYHFFTCVHGFVAGKIYHVEAKYEDGIGYLFINGINVCATTDVFTPDGGNPNTYNIGASSNRENLLNCVINYLTVNTTQSSKNDFNTIARLPFWSVNYTDYPDNATEYTDNLPYSSSIINSGTFKVDSDKLQCVSAGTITYSASYEFDGSEYIKVEIDGVEYAGTGTIIQGNTTVSVAQGSNKITIEMGTGDMINGDGIDIQFREEV